MKSSLILPLLVLFAPLSFAQNNPSLKIEKNSFSWVTFRKDLDPKIAIQHSNNNVSLARHDGKLFVAFRTSHDHFASASTFLYVMSSSDEGVTWQYENEVAMASDEREPILFSFKGRLFLYFFEGGTEKLQFKPIAMFRCEKLSSGEWTKPVQFGLAGEVPWEVKEHKGVAYMTSYHGPHYSFKPGEVRVLFKKSLDGVTWQSMNEDPDGMVYQGGVSEVGFEFDQNDNLWGVARNEDGDTTGFGSQIISADANDLGYWKTSARSSPDRYDSPRMFSHAGHLYLVSRRDIHGPFDLAPRFFPFNLRRWMNLIAYSLRPKRTAIFELNTETRALDWIEDLPSTGDNAYPSVAPSADGGVWIANYTSPLRHIHWPWISGQLSKQGTQIYLLKTVFNQN